VIFVAVTFHNLAAGLAFFTLLTFFERLPGIPASGSLLKFAGGVLLFAALRRSGTPLLFRDRPLMATAATLLVAWALASTLWAVDAAEARTQAFRLALGVVLVFIVFAAVREAIHVRWLVWAYLGGALLSASIGLGGASGDPGAAPAEATRLAGGIGDPNDLAALLVPALALSAFALTAFRHLRLVLAGCSAVLALALFLTQSRGGLVALAVGCLAALLLAGPKRPHALAVVLTVSALGVSYYMLVAPPGSVQRITNATSGGGTGRVDLWSVASEVAADHPISGVGIGNFPVIEPAYAAGTTNLPGVEHVVDDPKVVHNTYLEVLAELGSIGLLIFAALVAGALVLAFRAFRAFARSGDGEMEMLTRGLIVGLIGMLTAFIFISGEYQKHLWLLLGLAVATYAVAERREAARGAAALRAVQAP
jgi:O-antigen ligase